MDAHSLDCLDFQRIRELLAGFCLTGLGRSLALTIQPASRADLVRRWLSQVEELQKLEELRGPPPFGGITDVREIIRRCAPPLRVSVEEMAQVGDALNGTHAIAQYLTELPEGFSEIRHLAERIGDFQSIGSRIRAVIGDGGRVRDDASPKLNQIRRHIEEASARIHEAVQHLLHNPAIRKLLQYTNHTFHGDRLVLPVRTEYRGRLPGIVHRTSDSGATLYIEPAEAVELNNRISNLRSEEDEEIARLLWDLAHEIYINSAQVLKTLDTLAILDLIVAKTRFARRFDARCPQINEQPLLNVRQARHPLLLDLIDRKRQAGEPAEDIVPIDYRLGEDFNLLIITGPNTGGKTVTLKTLGLLSLMVQAGLPVPVGAGSGFGLFHNILIDIGDEQSMQQSLSTFSAHLKRQMDMLRKAGPLTLVLIDELGAGTDPDEGAAIGRAILDELLHLDCRCVVTTHLGALKGFALTRLKAENGCVEFDIRTLKPTYHLRIGEAGRSNAIDIAQHLGMPRRLVLAAKRNLSHKARALRAALEGTDAAKRQAEEARQAAETARLEAGRVLDEAGVAKARLEKQQADFQQWVQRVVYLRPGDAVRVRNFDRDGKIVRVRLDQQRAEVDVGAFAVEVPLGDVLPPETPPPPPPAPKVYPQTEADFGGRPMKGRHGRDGGRGGGRGESAGNREGGRGGQRDDRRTGGRDGGRGPGGDAAQAGRGQSGQRPHREDKPRPILPPITDEQAAALQPGDVVIAKRFHREGRVVRVNAGKKFAVVNIGALEVEVPFGGLALPTKPEAEPPRKPKPPKPETPAGEKAAAPAGNAVVSDAAAPPADAPPALEPAATRIVT